MFHFSFGLGSVYSKQEKYELALAHYYMAESINPKNVVILCHIGVVQNARQKTESALNWLGKSYYYYFFYFIYLQQIITVLQFQVKH